MLVSLLLSFYAPFIFQSLSWELEVGVAFVSLLTWSERFKLQPGQKILFRDSYKVLLDSTFVSGDVEYR